MGIVSSLEVYKMVKEGDLIIDPFVERDEATPPATIDLRLSAKTIHYRFDKDEYVLGEEVPEDQGWREEFSGNLYWLEPGQARIFVVREMLGLPATLAGIILPRSSLTRLGIYFQPTYLNPGYQGHCPILLVNHAAFRVGIPFKDGSSPRLAQALFWSLSSRPHRLYGEGLEDKYQHEEGWPAKFQEDLDIQEILAPFRKALDEI